MCGSPEPPPSPPDYSAQKAAFQQSQQGQYDAQAAKYNAAATAFNTNLANYGSKVSEGMSKFGNLTIADKDKIDEAYNFWGNLKKEAANPWTFNFTGTAPTQTQTQTQTGTNLGDVPSGAGKGQAWWEGTGLNLTGGTFDLPTINNAAFQTPETFTFNGLTGFNLTAPNFQSVVTTPYAGQTVSLNIPNLINPDLNGARGYLSQVDTALSGLASLRQQRQAELDRIAQFQTGYRGNLGDLEARLANIGIGDPNAINGIEAELNRIENQRRGFTSLLRNEFGDYFGQTSSEQDYNDIVSGLTGLRQRRDAEVNRNRAFEQQQMGLFDTVRNSLSGLNIGNIDQIKAYDQQIDDAARNIRRYNSDVSVDFTDELDAYNEVNSQIDKLYGQRTAEEQRIANFENSLLQRANALEAQAMQLGIADPRAFDALTRQAQQLRDEASRFSSALGFDFSQELNPLDVVGNTITERRAARAAEEQRIAQFRDSLAARLADLRQRTGSVNIADLNQLKALDAELSALEREGSRFNTELTFDPTDLTDSFGEIDRSIADLFNQRSTEEQRVRTATQTARDRAADILRSATLSDFYNDGNLNALSADIQRARSSASGFSSALTADFSGALADLTAAEERLNALRQQRSQRLGEIGAKAGSISSAIGAAELWDENAINGQRRAAEAALNDLAYFQGNDVADVRRSFADALGLADQRATELASKRTALETQARDLLSQNRDRSFFNDGELALTREQLAALEAEVNKYRAGQAEDEITSIRSRLGTEGNRLTTDATNRAKVEQADIRAGQEQIARNNIERFFQNLRMQPVSNTDYEDLVRMMRSNPTSAFSRSIGL